MELQVALPHMNIQPRPYRAQVVEALAQFVREWRQAAESQSLIDVPSSVGLLLFDITERLGFTQQEKHIVLGADLANEIEVAINQPLNLEANQ